MSITLKKAFQYQTLIRNLEASINRALDDYANFINTSELHKKSVLNKVANNPSNPYEDEIIEKDKKKKAFAFDDLLTTCHYLVAARGKLCTGITLAKTQAKISTSAFPGKCMSYDEAIAIAHDYRTFMRFAGQLGEQEPTETTKLAMETVLISAEAGTASVPYPIVTTMSFKDDCNETARTVAEDLNAKLSTLSDAIEACSLTTQVAVEYCPDFPLSITFNKMIAYAKEHYQG